MLQQTTSSTFKTVSPTLLTEHLQLCGWLPARRKCGVEHARLRSFNGDFISIGYCGCTVPIGSYALETLRRLVEVMA